MACRKTALLQPMAQAPPGPRKGRAGTRPVPWSQPQRRRPATARHQRRPRTRRPALGGPCRSVLCPTFARRARGKGGSARGRGGPRIAIAGVGGPYLERAACARRLRRRLLQLWIAPAAAFHYIREVIRTKFSTRDPRTRAPVHIACGRAHPYAYLGTYLGRYVLEYGLDSTTAVYTSI